MHYSRLAIASQLLAVGYVSAGVVRRDASTVQSANGYSYLGCAGDPNQYGGTGRALTDNSTDTSDMTIEECASYCGASNYQYFGVEYYSQCFCGNTLQPATTIEADNSNCTLTCKGNANEYCGGNWHLNLYGLPAGGSASNYNGASSSSTSTSAAATTTAQAATTASATTTTAAAATPIYAGTVQCPAANGTTFTSGANTYQIQCYIDHNGGDATNTMTNSMDDCLAACSNYTGCTDVSWVPGSPGPCYIKTSVTTGNSNQNVWGAVLVSSGSSASSTAQTSSSTSSSAIVTSTVAASTTSTVAASTTSSSTVKPSSSSINSMSTTSSSTSSAVKTSTTTSSLTSTTAAPATTMKTSTTSTTTKASSTSSTSTAATANPTFFSLSSCPSISVSLGSWFPATYKYTPYYTGSGYTENSVNPANLAPSLYPAQQYSIAGSNNACQAAQICLNNIKSLSTPYLSIDLHYVSTSSSWQCTAYSGYNILGGYFNVPNAAVTKAYGFAGVLSGTSIFSW